MTLADPIATRPELLSLTSSGPLHVPVLSTPLAARRAQQHSGPSHSRERDAVYYTPQCKRLEQRIQFHVARSCPAGGTSCVRVPA